MNRIRCTALAAVLVLLSMSTSMASIIPYTADGYIVDKQGTTLPINGWVNIDDQLRDQNTLQPTEVHDGMGIDAYKFIADFSLNIGEYPFSGDGILLLSLGRWSDSGELELTFTEWELSGDEDSIWNGWVGYHFDSFNADGTPQDVSRDGVSPAEIIQLTSLMHIAPKNYPDPVFNEAYYPFNITLRKDSAPVPEPATMALLGASALGMLLHRRRGSRR